MKLSGSVLALVALVLFCGSAVRAETFTAYLEGAQEVPPVSTSGRGYARIFVNEAAGTISFVVVFNGMTSNQTAAHIHAPAPVGSSAGVAIDLGTVGGTSGTLTGSGTITPTQLAQLRAGLGYVNVHSAMFPGGELRGQLARPRPVDYDGDGRQDISVMRFPSVPPPGLAQVTYWNLNSTSGVSATDWGDANRDFPVPGDYDGDGLGDIAVYRGGTGSSPDSVFYILRSSDGGVQALQYGVVGDQAVARDYDGDGRTDPAIYRRGPTPASQAVWWIRLSSTGTDMVVPFGTTGDSASADTPVPGDYDGDGKFDIAVYRFGNASNPPNSFIIRQSSDGAVTATQWGNFTTDWVVPGDYDGDGKFDLAVARTGPSGNSPMDWWIRRSSAPSAPVGPVTFGLSSDFPVQGDYDGDGRADLAIYRPGPTTGTQSSFWYLRSLDGGAVHTLWGIRGDFAVASFDAR